jgi:putative DNA primase/helicase
MIGVERLPIDIRESDRAVVWRYELRDGRWTKVPYIATRPNVRAAVDDPRTWAPFAVAHAAFRAGNGDGVGIVLGAGLCGVDLDHVRDAATGVVVDDVMAIIALLDSYTEISPSGAGLHVLARGVLPRGGRRRGCLEMYDGGRFFTVTGLHLTQTPYTVEERTTALAALHAQIFGTAAPAAPTTWASSVQQVRQDDGVLLAQAHAARNGAKFAALWRGDTTGYASASEADLALCSLLVFWTVATPNASTGSSARAA